MISDILIKFTNDKYSYLSYSWSGGDKIKVTDNSDGSVGYESIEMYPEEILKLKERIKDTIERLVER